MYEGLKRLFAAAFVAGAVAAGVALIVAPAALACSGGPSAYNVYRECLSNGGSGGGKHNGHGGSAGSRPTAGSQSGGGTPAHAHVSNNVAKALSHAGPDKGTLQSLYNSAGKTRFLYSSHASSPVSEPSALGSAFDPGSGPTVLLLALVGSAVVLLGMTGMRELRRRR